MTVQLEYINQLLQSFKKYSDIMLNALSHLLCSKLCWHNRPIPIHHSEALVSEACCSIACT